MCRIMGFTNGSRIELDDDFLTAVKSVVCEGNPDAFGYSAQGSKGLFGERTIKTKGEFRSRFNADNHVRRLPFIEPLSNRFGTRAPIIGSFIAHGRFSTNSKALECAHPYVSDRVSLIHNGVVKDMAETKIKTETNNDTEVLFRYWLQGGLPAIEQNVSGYYALLIQTDITNLHVVKDSAARLCVGYITDLKSYVFATSEDMIYSLCDKMDWECEITEPVRDNTYLIFNGNNMVHQAVLTPRQDTVIDKAVVKESLGYEYDDGSVDLVKQISQWESGSYVDGRYWNDESR